MSNLTQSEQDIFNVLFRAKGYAIHPDEITRATDIKAVRVHIHRMRKKLPANYKIKTVKGYRLVETV